MRSRGSTFSAAALAALLAAVPGCAPVDNSPAPLPDSASPRIVTDLSSISSAPVAPVVPSQAAALALATDAEDTTSGRKFSEQPGMLVHVGTAREPGEEIALNAKTAKFARFSRDIMDQLFVALRSAEHDEQISKLKLPEDPQPTVVTATLDPSGKLTELVLEQHSGKAMIDRMVIAACKRAVWAKNPPLDAATANGTYRLRIETKIVNLISMDGSTWTFTTTIKMAIL